MRRGHSGIGTWRNENPWHFRPPSGGNPGFRPSRPFKPHENIRFSSGPRPHRPPLPFIRHPRQADEQRNRRDVRPEHHERHTYGGNRSDLHPRQRYPILSRMGIDSLNDTSNIKQNYNDNRSNQFQVNSMGDVDQRQLFKTPTPEPPGQRPYPWSTEKMDYDYRNPFKSHRQYGDTETKVPLLDYPGHRPPASDHYGTPVSTIESSNTFSRSVDDTVNIVRKRLLSRGESQSLLEQPPDEDRVDYDQSKLPTSYQNVLQEPPTRKRVAKQKNINLNCDKMKNKIVHQLFKMDKAKIHKLMDNPSSSTKFEYAISSLITESQNSLNRHLRSVAEESLCSSSAEFIHNDTNAIYEDTFMKQMQCILDPQDTVFLEDIKPIVLGELSKALQLDSIDQLPEMVEEVEHFDYDYRNYAHSADHDPENVHDFYQQETDFERPIMPQEENTRVTENNEPNVLFERRPAKIANDYSQEKISSIEKRRQSRRSVDSKASDKYRQSPQPYFNTNLEQLSDEEDPFAELDNQYHVAVDHNFIENDGFYSPQMHDTNQEPKTKPKDELSTPKRSPTVSFISPIKISTSVKNDIDNQLFDLAKSPLKLGSSDFKNTSNISEHTPTEREIKTELVKNTDSELDSNVIKKTVSISDNTNNTVKQEYKSDSESTSKDTHNSEVSKHVSKSSIASNARKRSIDQRPSHRKEKRKKNEPNLSDTNKQILNKNIIINVNDCKSKKSEKCDSGKSIFNLFFSKDQNPKDISKLSKDIKQNEFSEKPYSDKYVKRKDTTKKTRDQESEMKNKNESISSSHSIMSPKDKIYPSFDSQNLKIDANKKLKAINMFEELPRKQNIHQSHRNTSVPPTVTIKGNTETINKQSVLKTLPQSGATGVRKILTKEFQTFESKSTTSRYCQTEMKKNAVKTVQTDPVTFGKPISKSTDVFERMKEIDLEIQVLLQEKFKLYSSLESKESCPNTMQNLGMTVLNVSSYDDTKEPETATADSIIEDFTNIPVEELEQIAFETVEAEQEDTKERTKRTKRQKVLANYVKEAPVASVKKNEKKTKTPNISLLEQIITDDRPLEDIISLDDYEITPVKTKTSKAKAIKKSKKKSIKLLKNLKKQKAVKNLVLTNPKDFNIRECFVLLKREDFSKYLEMKKPTVVLSPVKIAELLTENEKEINIEDNKRENIVKDNSLDEIVKDNKIEEIVEDIVSDLQFDMLDVSEDIVIGCEVKVAEDKDLSNDRFGTFSDEIILDNSQSSSDEVIPTDSVHNENTCKVYDYSADENLRRESVVVNGHADAVLSIECIENNFLAACLDGNVYYFNAEGQLISTLRGSNLAVTCLTIVKEKYGTTVYTGSLDSRIRYYDLETGLEKGPECNVLSPIQTMDKAWDTVFVGTRTGFVLQFECKNNMLIPVSTVKFSEQSILALRAMKEGPRKVLLVAARSENVTIKDAQSGLLLRTLSGPKMTVYTLLYEEGKVFCGTSCHQIYVFDYASGTHINSHEGGKGAVCLRVIGGLLFAGCYDGCVYVYREGERHPFAQLRGPSLMLLSLAVVGSKIIAGYKDRSLYIWKIPLCILQEMIL